MLKTLLLLTILIVTSALPAAAQVDTENPKTARDFYERGLKLEDAKQFAEAIEDYKKAAELDSGFFDAHFTRSSLHAKQRDYQAAVDALAESLKARPRDYSALFNSGLYYEYLREYDSAIAFYTQASDQDADFSHFGGSIGEARAHALHYRGRVYQWYKKDNVKAVADYSEALDLDPAIEMVLYRRAVAHHDLGNYAESNADFEAEYERSPDDANLLNAWAWQLATCPDDKYRNGLLALQLAKKTKDTQTLAAAYAEVGAFDKAVASQRQALQSLDREPKPANENAAARLAERRDEMQARLTTYEASRPFRDK